MVQPIGSMPNSVDIDFVTQLGKEFNDIETFGSITDATNALVKELEKYNVEQPNETFVNQLIQQELNLNNYEEILGLKQYNSVNIKTISNQKIHSIMYNDNDGYTMAIVQIDFQRNKMVLEFLSDILPKQNYNTPKTINDIIVKKAIENNWSTEDGGINQFNGNIEIRYKNADGNVMSAIISTPEGNVETIVVYKYENGKRSQMVNTGQFGQVTTVYSTVKEVLQLMSIEIDTDGSVLRITKNFDN